MSNRIIIIDDEPDFLDTVRRGLIISGFRDIVTENNPESALAYFKDGKEFDIALIDITMPSMDGRHLLQYIKNHSPDTECIMVTGLNEAYIAVECMKNGAYDYLTKPFSKDELLLTIERALERKRLLDVLDINKKDKSVKKNLHSAFSPIITQAPDVLRILKEAELHAASNVPVLITGESGTGKELLAHAIHDASPRAKHTYTPVNMASMSTTLFDAEFFGHTKGAYTGAEKKRKGYLEHTNKGTLFLDEIGHLPMELQGKLLRVFQGGEYLKLGNDNPQQTDIRFVAATNAKLDNLIARGEFRKDLYYRLKGAWLHLPPLRERKNDIPLLIRHFLENLSTDSNPCQIENEALHILSFHDYPGNIRELNSVIQSAYNLARGNLITVAHLPEMFKRQKPRKLLNISVEPGTIEPLSQAEEKHIIHVYNQTGQNKSQTARLLEIGLNTLRRKLASYNIS